MKPSKSQKALNFDLGSCLQQDYLNYLIINPPSGITGEE